VLVERVALVARQLAVEKRSLARAARSSESGRPAMVAQHTVEEKRGLPVGIPEHLCPCPWVVEQRWQERQGASAVERSKALLRSDNNPSCRISIARIDGSSNIRRKMRSSKEEKWLLRIAWDYLLKIFEPIWIETGKYGSPFAKNQSLR
jgi:hypothetical protein